eukprot:3611843-Rhodomonas_salina.1
MQGQEKGESQLGAGDSSAAVPDEHQHMGVEHFFVGEMDEDMLCGICQNVMVKPHSCHPGHNFCLWCISQWLQSNPTCPFGREATQASQL